MNRATVLIAALVVLLLAATGAYFLQTAWQKPLPVLQTLGGDFLLPSTLGRDTAVSEFRGRVVLLNFGYTSCPDVCPTALARMRAVLSLLTEQAEQVQPLFVTIDPERDSVEKLRPYLGFFHPSFIGMSGDREQTKTVADLYRVYYQKQRLDSAMAYGFTHNDHIYLLDQQGRVRAMYSGSSTPKTIANAVATLL